MRRSKVWKVWYQIEGQDLKEFVIADDASGAMEVIWDSEQKCRPLILSVTYKHDVVLRKG